MAPPLKRPPAAGGCHATLIRHRAPRPRHPYPNDAPLLRIVGRIADGWGDSALARILFERALAIAPRETQTWRELMLLESRADDAQSLADLRRYQAAERDSAGGEHKIELDYYDTDATAVGAETLAHVIVYEYGHRRDLVIVLDGAKARVPVVTLRGKGGA